MQPLPLPKQILPAVPVIALQTKPAPVTIRLVQEPAPPNKFGPPMRPDGTPILNLPAVVTPTKFVLQPVGQTLVLRPTSGNTTVRSTPKASAHRTIQETSPTIMLVPPPGTTRTVINPVLSLANMDQVEAELALV